MIKQRSRLAAFAVAAVALLSACELEKADPNAPPPQPPPPPADLVSDKAPTPTDDRLIFASGADEPDLEIYTTFADGSGRNRVTRNRTGESGPTTYPDSGILYYVCENAEMVCYSDSAGNIGTYVFNTQRLGYALVEDPVISPDGSRLAFTAIKISPDGKSTNYDIYFYDFLADEFINAIVGPAQDQMPTWVNDNVLVWSRLRQNDYELVSYDLSGALGQAPVGLTDNDTDDLGADASRDGSKISFISTSLTDPNSGTVRTIPYTGAAATPTDVTPVMLERGFIGGDPDTAWSPDGTKIAYAGIPSGESDVEIFTVPASGGTPTNVTQNDVYDVDPHWAVIPPAFSVSDPATVTEGNNASIVFKIELDVPQSTTLTVNYATVAGTATAGSDFTARTGTATFAPGQTEVEVSVPVLNDTTIEPLEKFTFELTGASGVAVISDYQAEGKIRDDEVEPSPTPSVEPTGTPTSPEVIAYQSDNSVWTVEPDGTDSKQVIASAASPDLLPGGSTFVVSAPAPSSTADIHTAPASGGTTTKINGTSAYDGSPSWGPAGAGVAWVVADGGSLRTYYAEPPTGTPSQLPEGTLYPNWGKVGTSEVIAVSHNGQLKFFDPATGADTGRSLPEGYFPAISPDGTKLAFNDDLHGDQDIYVLDLTNPGASPVHLTTNSAHDTNPVWSPDGQWLAFVTQRGGNGDIYKMRYNAPDSEVAVVATSANENEPTWGGGVATTSAPAETDEGPSGNPDGKPGADPSDPDGPRGPSSDPSPIGMLIPALLGSWALKRRKRS